MEHSNTTNSDAGTGSGIVDRVRERATAQLSSQKDRATDGLGSVAQAVPAEHEAPPRQQAGRDCRDTSRRLPIRSIASRPRSATAMSGELVNEVQRFARRQPALFVGSAFAIGVIGARFLKSSSDNQRHRALEPYGTSSRGTMDYAGRGI